MPVDKAFMTKFASVLVDISEQTDLIHKKVNQIIENQTNLEARIKALESKNA